MKHHNVDFNEIQKAMEDTDRDAFDYFLDSETGHVVILSEDIITRAQDLLSDAMDEDETPYDAVEFDEEIALPDWMEDEVDLALAIFLTNRERYVRIPERNPADCHAAMLAFANRLPDDCLRKHLLSLLDGPGAFRRFRDALAPHAKERKDWHRFNARRSREEISTWLASVMDIHDDQDTKSGPSRQ